MSHTNKSQFSRRHILVSLGLAVVAISVVVVMRKGLNLDTTQIPSALLNRPANDFTVDWIQGQEYLNNTDSPTFHLHDFKGEPVILNFWASWCFSCRQEAYDFERFWQNFKDKGVKVVGIAIQDTPEAAMKFAKSYQKSYILGLDNDGKTAIDYGVTGVPETFLIDENGVIIYKVAGPVNEKKLEEFAAILMNRKSS
ncbi:MAG: redoxin domain-containing protein [Pseudobacteriovorax sp.]|nr:redoxin domain-containing protein [Pseudobacteriovorax sp.]